MRVIGFLIFLAIPAVAFYVGRATANRQPGANHQQMARFIDRVLEQDELTPILSREDRADGVGIVGHYYKTIHPEEST